MNEEEQEKLYDLLFKDTKNKLEATIEKQQKEIEKLKELLEYKRKYCSELEEDLFRNCRNYVIPKDKIREKMKSIKERRNKEIDEIGCSFLGSAIDILEELLKENTDE